MHPTVDQIWSYSAETAQMISLISSCYRAAGSLSGYRVPPPPLHHHPSGEGLRTCAQCCKVSQTRMAKVQSFDSIQMLMFIHCPMLPGRGSKTDSCLQTSRPCSVSCSTRRWGVNWIIMNLDKSKGHVSHFNAGMGRGQTVHWQVQVRVYPRVPSQFSHCFLPGPSRLAKKAHPARVTSTTFSVFIFSKQV